MSANKKGARCERSDAPIVHADWTVGLRTSAWDRLWNMILSDLGPLPEHDVREAEEPEGQDG